LGLEVVSDLRELVGDGVGSVLEVGRSISEHEHDATDLRAYPRSLQFLVRAHDDVEHLLLGLSGGRSVRQDDDQQRLLQLVGAGGAEEEGLDDLGVELGSERGQACEGVVSTCVCVKGKRGGRTGESNLLDEVEGGLFRVDAVAFDAGVHESDL
jgi:hypothetical protein